MLGIYNSMWENLIIRATELHLFTRFCEILKNYCSYEVLPKHNIDNKNNFLFKVVCERKEAFASACAIARAFPLYSRKSSKGKMPSKTITVEFVIVGDNNTPISSEDANCMSIVAESIRLSARLVDAPCQEMHTSAFVKVMVIV